MFGVCAAYCDILWVFVADESILLFSTIMALAAGAGPSMKRTDVQRRRQRRAQRQWIQLVEAWTRTTAYHGPSDDRVELLEQITHHSQTIVKIVRDRDWLVIAFQMAISAVLFPPRSDQRAVDSDVLQLGQQLLQLAIHSVCRPYLKELSDAQHAHGINEALTSFEELAARLSVHDTLSGLTEMLDLPPLPLDLVLRQSASSLLVNLASLPQSSDLFPPLLSRHSTLITESAPARLSILANLIRSSASNLRNLVPPGLLISWRDGRESSIWTDSATPLLDLEMLISFYTEQVASLSDIGCDEEALSLCNVLRSELLGSDGQAAFERIESSITMHAEQKEDTESTRMMDVDGVKVLALSAPSLAQSEGATQVAADTLAKLSPKNAAVELAQMVDVSDSPAVRALILSIIDLATLPPTEMSALFVSVLYARPAASSVRIDINCPNTLLDHFVKTATSLLRQVPPSSQASLNLLLRSALDANEDCIVPAHQLLTYDAGTIEKALQHLDWLTSITKLMQAAAPIASAAAIDVCWLAAYGGDSSPSLAVQQEEALTQLIETFAMAFVGSRSADKGVGGGGIDVVSLRIKAAWTTFFQDALALCDNSEAPFAALTRARAIQLILQGVLRTGDVDLFRTLSTDSSVTGTLSSEEVETLVLAVSTELYDRASVGSMRNRDIKMAMDVLEAVPGTPVRVQTQRNFIEASCRLCSFKVKSRVRPGTMMEPREIRDTADRMELIGRLLATQEDAYRSPELVLEIATKLSGGASAVVAAATTSSSPAAQRTLVEIRTLAMLADSATSSDNFDEAAAFCHRLVDKVNILRTRTSSNSTLAATDLLTSAVDLGWKSCYQLSKHPGWDDTPSRITMLAHALTLCPAAQLQSLLKQWSSLDQQLVTELEQGKQFASTKKAAAGWLNIGGGGSGVANAGPHQHLTAQNAAATAASVGAGLVGMGANAAANLLPLSFSPLSYFHTHQQQQATATEVETEAPSRAAGGGETNRAASLFDFDQSATSVYAPGMDPTERAVRAARAARDFLGWKSSQQPSTGSSSTSANTGATRGSGFSLSKGVGWLIGEEKH